MTQQGRINVKISSISETPRVQPSDQEAPHLHHNVGVCIERKEYHNNINKHQILNLIDITLVLLYAAQVGSSTGGELWLCTNSNS